jgi:hypothetical protein
VLADFTNTTGDTVFDGTLRQGLAVQLEQSLLSLVSEQQIQQNLSMMDQPAAAKLTPEIAFQLSVRTGGTAVLDGSIAQIGTQYNLILRPSTAQAANRSARYKGLIRRLTKLRTSSPEAVTLDWTNSSEQKQKAPRSVSWAL